MVHIDSVRAVDRIAATLSSLKSVIVEFLHVVDPARAMRGPQTERLESVFRYSSAREIVKLRSSYRCVVAH